MVYDEPKELVDELIAKLGLTVAYMEAVERQHQLFSKIVSGLVSAA
jgi:hypothetical protein